jgi:hydroxymethylbilane synthase
MIKNHLVIATRESALALWQANWVKERLETLHPELFVSLLGITTQSDMMPSSPLANMSVKGSFVKELEDALLDGRADVAVHSMKDVSMELPENLCLPVMCEREDPRDVFISNKFSSFYDIPSGSIIGTSSLRRQSQLYALRPDLKVKPIRGNVNTRLKRLDDDEYSAIILAAAGLIRLGLKSRIRDFLSIEHFLPAAGQGVIGVECRVDDLRTQQLIAPLDHAKSNVCVTAERALCRRLGGGCHIPLASYAELQNETLILRGLVAHEDGSLILRSQHSDTYKNAEQLGLMVANDLLRQGAGDILSAIYNRNN